VISNGGPLNIPAGGFLVLGRNSNFATNGGVTVNYTYSSVTLANGDDELILLDTGLTEVDRVEWDGGPAFPDPTGASMSLDDPTSDNNVGANWCTAITPFGDGDLGTPGAANDCPTIPPFGVCGELATFIHDVQGNGPASPLIGNVGEVLEGIVVGDFQGTTRLRGFFLQEEDFDADGDAATSEGIFVFDNGFKDVAMGDVVRVQGDVAEFSALTEITNVIELSVCAAAGPVPAATTVTLPVNTADEFERWEGMLVTLPQTLYASGNFTWGRFGEVDLSLDAPLDNPTNIVAPGVAAIAIRELNNRSRIQLDDGSSVQNPTPLPPYIGAGNTLRTGDSVAEVTAVLSERLGVYELHPVDFVTFTRLNTRPGPPDVGGAVRVASFNVLNYFITLDDSGAMCGPAGVLGCRGADTADEFTRQRDKLVTAISKLDAHVVGLIELENHPFDAPIADLVTGLNAVARASRKIRVGQCSPSPSTI